MKLPARRWYAGKIMSLGVVFLGAGAVLLIYMLRTLIGPFAVLPQVAGGPVGALWVEPGQAIERSAWERDRLRSAWAELLPTDLDRLARTPAASLEGRTGLAVVSDAAALDDAELDALLEFAQRGGSVLLAGWIAGDGSGPATAMERALGREVAALERDRAWFAAAGRRGPLNAGTDPGLRIGLAPAERSPAVDDPAAELFWSSWDLRPSGPQSAAALRIETGRGRIAWIGIDPVRASGSPGSAWLARVYANAWAWASRRPVGELHAWPDGAPFAGLLAMDTETGFANAGPVADAALADAFPVTFLLVSSLAREHPGVVRKLTSAGEVGSHADVHDGFKDVDRDAQRERLATSRREIEALGAPPLRGFRPPYESYDPETLRALAELGFDYQLGNLELVSAAPQLVRIEGATRPLVQIPRPILDDYDLFERRGIRTAEQMLDVLRGEMERMRAIGGLHYFSFHTQFISDAARVAALRTHARELRERGAWLAGAGELAGWWRRRSAVAATIEDVGPSRAQLRITNTGEVPIHGLVLRLYTNAPTRSLRVSSTRIGEELAARWLGGGVQSRHEPGAQHADLLLPEIPAGASRGFFIDYDAGGVVAATGE